MYILYPVHTPSQVVASLLALSHLELRLFAELRRVVLRLDDLKKRRRRRIWALVRLRRSLRCGQHPFLSPLLPHYNKRKLVHLLPLALLRRLIHPLYARTTKNLFRSLHLHDLRYHSLVQSVAAPRLGVLGSLVGRAEVVIQSPFPLSLRRRTGRRHEAKVAPAPHAPHALLQKRAVVAADWLGWGQGGRRIGCRGLGVGRGGRGGGLSVICMWAQQQEQSDRGSGRKGRG